MNCLPSISKLVIYTNRIDFNKEVHNNDIILIKFIIEIYRHYLREFDIPYRKVNIE